MGQYDSSMGQYDSIYGAVWLYGAVWPIYGAGLWDLWGGAVGCVGQYDSSMGQ